MQCCDHENSAVKPSQEPAAAVAAGASEAVFLIQKMDCPTEEKLIRDRFQGMKDIDGMQFNLMQREVTVQHRLPLTAAILDALKMCDCPIVEVHISNIHRREEKWRANSLMTPAATGIISGLGSLGPIVQELLIGKMYSAKSGDLGPIFAMLLGAAIAAALSLLFMLARSRAGKSDL